MRERAPRARRTPRPPSSPGPGPPSPRPCAAARRTPISFVGPDRLRQAPPRRGRSRPSCSPADAPDPDEARRRALADPSPHPDLVWLRPPGTQHLVDEVRERVIGAAAYRPFEGGAPRLRDRGRRRDGRREPERAPEDARGAGRLRPPDPDHRRARARCSRRCGRAARSCVRAAPAEAVEQRRLASRPGDGGGAPGRRAAGRRRPRPGRACLVGDGRARELRAEAADARAALAGELAGCALGRLLARRRGGSAAPAPARRAARARGAAAEAGEGRGDAPARRAREAEEAAKRAARRARTEALDLGLGLVAAWLRDLAAVAEGAEELV